MKRWSCVLIMLGLLLSYGCFDYNEELWINPDGSGRLKIDIGMGEKLLEMAKEQGKGDPLKELRENYDKAKKTIEQKPVIKRFDYQEYAVGTMKHFVFDIEVKDITKVNEIHKQIMQNSLSEEDQKLSFRRPEIVVERIENNLVRFSQTFGNAADDKKAKDDSAGKIAQSLGRTALTAMLGDKFVTVQVHAPKFVESNGRIDNDLTTCEWKIPLLDLVGDNSTKHKLRALVVLPTTQRSWIIYPAGGVIVVIIASIIIGILVKRGRRR